VDDNGFGRAVENDNVEENDTTAGRIVETGLFNVVRLCMREALLGGLFMRGVLLGGFCVVVTTFPRF
jgi:hypothetical protein